ncbi:hypothetical protein, partial [Bacillus pumilus]|uniref:hypothetical protein n=1 Tax=Bacillus pumilus TaxID=1408 RepID=UPI0011AA5C65
MNGFEVMKEMMMKRKKMNVSVMEGKMREEKSGRRKREGRGVKERKKGGKERVIWWMLDECWGLWEGCMWMKGYGEERVKGA